MICLESKEELGKITDDTYSPKKKIIMASSSDRPSKIALSTIILLQDHSYVEARGTKGIAEKIL